MNPHILFLIFLITAFKIKTAETPPYIDVWVVWNVGQGQWVTHVLSDECVHFDIGGEFGSFKILKKKLIYHCGKKKNKLNLSHWDYDHFLNIPSLSKTLPQVCWETLPEFAHTKKAAAKILDLGIPGCFKPRFNMWVPFVSRNTNESSLVFLEQQVLLPGDSPIQQEKLWAYEMNSLATAQVLILGHHGSRTSTGKLLLSVLSGLKWAVASARYGKYKHPHKDTLQRLKEQRIPVLKTEDWGNIWFTPSPDGQMRPDSDSQ